MNGPRYSIFPADCLSDPRFKDVHLRVLALIGTHTDNRGWCTVNQRKLGEACGKSRETINRAIKDLCDMGYLSKRDQVTKANGRTISQYRVLMDRPDETPDVADPVTSASQGAVTPEDHSPCDVAASQHNDPSFNDHPSLRSDQVSERVSFDEIWKVYPRRPMTNRSEAQTVYAALSDAETHRVLIAAKRFAQWHIEDSAARKVDPASQLEYRVGLGKWLRGAWVEALSIVLLADPILTDAGDLVALPPEHPDFKAVERMLGKKLFVGDGGKRTFRLSEIEQARQSQGASA